MAGLPYVATLFGVSILTTLVILVKKYMQGGIYRGTERLDGKTVIITGANAGLGKATAREMARRGAHVIMACRNLIKANTSRDEILRDITSASLEIVELDLASFDSIRAFAQQVDSKFETIDVLINNAAVISYSRKQTVEGLELTLGVCHFGHFMLTNLLMKQLKSARQGRVIFLASRGQEHGIMDFEDLHYEKKHYNPFAAYNIAKLANVLCTREMSRRLSDTRVTVNCLHPGVVVTDIGRDLPLLNNNSIIGYLLTLPIRLFLVKDDWAGIQTCLRLTLDPTLSSVSGKYFADCKEVDPSTQAQDDVTARKLWEISEAVTMTTIK